jgi:hypothetical protein
MHHQGRIQPGWAAYDRDGTRLGDVERVDDRGVVIAPAESTGDELRFPLADVASVDPDAGVVQFDTDASTIASQASRDRGRNDGVEGLGFTGRDEDASTGPGDEVVDGLGFTGRDDTSAVDDPRH